MQTLTVRNLIAKPSSGPNKKTSEISSTAEFLSSIVHELKTPLSAIIGFSEILEDEIRNPQYASECAYYAKEINLASIELLEIVHDLLDVGTANSGHFSVNLNNDINIIDVTKRAIRLNWDYSLKRNITLKLQVNGQELRQKNHSTTDANSALIPLVKLDSKRMKQILTNIISNSIKYSPAKTEVMISINTTSLPSLEIIVEDQGFGMDQEQLSKLFTKYQTFHNPNSDKVDSFGLGLTITKELVELQGGTIEVESTKGKGTKVRLAF